MTAVKDLPRPGPDQERAALLRRINEANSKLDDTFDLKSSMSLEAANCNQRALAEVMRLQTIESDLHKQIDMLQTALSAYDARRHREAEERHAERAAKAEQRRQLLITNAFNEAQPQYLRTIKRFADSGNVRNAALWRRELEGLRATLERQYPAPHQPTDSFVLGAPDNNAP
jgi:hypothetical protein